MRQLRLTTRTHIDWGKAFVDESNYDELLTESCAVYKPDGSLLAILLKDIIPTEINARAWAVLKNYKSKTDARGVATGIKSGGRKKLDGTISNVSKVPKGWEVISGVLGFFERTVRYPYGHACTWNAENPVGWDELQPLFKLVNKLFAEHVPDRWLAQCDVADRCHRAWVIPGTVFSTITINKNFRTACHVDAGDLPEGFSCLSVIREGTFTGGHLVLPDFRVAAELKTGDLILFDPHEFHGNCQIVPLSKGAQRCSLVYYMREKIQYCLSPEEELLFAKNRKEGTPLWPNLQSSSSLENQPPGKPPL